MENTDPFSNQFNNSEKGRLIDNARLLRTALIGSVFHIFQEFHIEDLHTRETAKVGKYVLWLTADTFEVPTKEGEPQESMTFAVSSPNRGERLRFHVPVGEDFDRDSLDAIEYMEAPGEIAIERQVYTPACPIGRTTLRVALDTEHMYFYRTAADTQAEEELYGTDETLIAEFNRGFDSHIGLVASFNEDLINWQAVPQRQITRHKDGSVNVQDI